MYAIKVRAFLQFATGETFDIYSFYCRYNIITSANPSDVPIASVRIPVDVSTVTGSNPGGNVILDNFEYFRFNLCAIFCDVARTAFQEPEDTSFTPGIERYLLFIGFPVAASKTFVGEVPNIELQIKHWLAFLDLTNVFNSAIPSGAVGHFSLFHPNTFLLFGDLADFGASLKFLPLTLLNEMYDNVDQSQWDLWWYILFPLLDQILLSSVIIGSYYRITQNDPTFLRLGRLARQALYCTNPALSKIPISFYNIEYDQLFHRYIRKVTSKSSPSKIAKEFADVLRRNMAEDLGNILEAVREQPRMSLLQLMVTLLSHFHCALIPYPIAYGVVPFCLGLQNFWSNKPGPTILCGDILDLAISNIPSAEILPVRASIAITDHVFHAGAQLEENKGRNALVGGAYISRRMIPGTFSVFPLPSFYREILNASIVFTPTPSKPLFEILNETENAIGEVNQEQGDDWIGSVVSAADIGRYIINRYAQGHYVTNQIQNRRINVQTYFRGDIAPGSTIRVQLFHPADTPDGKAILQIQGTVIRVEYFGSPQMTGTRYEIIGWRTIPEMNHPDFSIPTHPIYGVHWSGNYHLVATPIP